MGGWGFVFQWLFCTQGWGKNFGAQTHAGRSGVCVFACAQLVWCVLFFCSISNTLHDSDKNCLLCLNPLRLIIGTLFIVDPWPRSSSIKCLLYRECFCDCNQCNQEAKRSQKKFFFCRHFFRTPSSHESRGIVLKTFIMWRKCARLGVGCRKWLIQNCPLIRDDY